MENPFKVVPERRITYALGNSSRVRRVTQFLALLALVPVAFLSVRFGDAPRVEISAPIAVTTPASAEVVTLQLARGTRCYWTHVATQDVQLLECDGADELVRAIYEKGRATRVVVARIQREPGPGPTVTPAPAGSHLARSGA